MAKNRNDYFELLVKQCSYCAEAAELLEIAFQKFSYEAVPSIKKDMHAIERKADELRHDILTRLSAEFITPIDQEDILELVQIIDDITDALDEVMQEVYMYDFHQLPTGAADFSKLVLRCVNSMMDVVKELKNFKKPETLSKLLKEVGRIETEADEAYTEAIHYIFSNSADAKTLIGSKSILGSMEDCCDLCEHAADLVEQIIIKNT